MHIKVLVLLFLICFSSYGQNQRDKDIAYRNFQREMYKKDIYTSLNSDFNGDSINEYLHDPNEFKPYQNKYFNIIGSDAWLKYDYKKFQIKVIPTFDIEGGVGSDNSFIFSRGLLIYGQIGEKFKYYAINREAQIDLPEQNRYEFYNKRKYIIPNLGTVKVLNNELMEASFSSGEISYKPNEYFEISFGNGNHFFGEGYHSLFLSDNSYAYPSLKLHSEFGRLRYSVLYSQFLNLHQKEEVFGTTFQKKGGVFKYIEIDIHKRFSLSFFEGVIFQMEDSNHTRGFEIGYLNPIIFLRPVEFSLGSPDNALMGLGFKSNWKSKGVFYGQFVLDDINVSKMINGEGHFQSKYGTQLGWKHYNFIGRKDWFMQAEFNYVRPYVYGHKEISQNYGHYNQALAHPLEANFYQLFIRSIYRHKRFEFSVKGELFIKGENDDNDLSYGGDIFVSELNAVNGVGSFGNHTGQGADANGYAYRASVSYIANPFINMKYTIGLSGRSQNNWNRSSDYFFIGVKSDLFRNYQNLY